jgi:hypothetical protein
MILTCEIRIVRSKKLPHDTSEVCVAIKLSEDLRGKYTVQLSHYSHQNVLV